MIRDLIRQVAQLRTLVYAIVAACWAALFIFMTVRLLRQGAWLEAGVSAAMAALGSWGTRRWIHRFRRSSLASAELRGRW
jgi:hypothetical protein